MDMSQPNETYLTPDTVGHPPRFVSLVLPRLLLAPLLAAPDLYRPRSSRTKLVSLATRWDELNTNVQASGQLLLPF